MKTCQYLLYCTLNILIFINHVRHYFSYSKYLPEDVLPFLPDPCSRISWGDCTCSRLPLRVKWTRGRSSSYCSFSVTLKDILSLLKYEYLVYVPANFISTGAIIAVLFSTTGSASKIRLQNPHYCPRYSSKNGSVTHRLCLVFFNNEISARVTFPSQIHTENRQWSDLGRRMKVCSAGLSAACSALLPAATPALIGRVHFRFFN